MDNMLSLTLLKNVSEYRDLKLSLIAHKLVEKSPDIEWLNKEHEIWSKQYPDYNQTLNEMYNQYIGFAYNKCESKERLLKLFKALDICVYIDLHLDDAPTTEIATNC